MPSPESRALQSYRDRVVNVAPLDRETERELSRRFRAGDRRAGDRLVTACLPFVISIALEYRRWGVPLEDVVQQGNIGLLRAAAKFDPDRECRSAGIEDASRQTELPVRSRLHTKLARWWRRSKSRHRWVNFPLRCSSSLRWVVSESAWECCPALFAHA